MQTLQFNCVQRQNWSLRIILIKEVLPQSAIVILSSSLNILSTLDTPSSPLKRKIKIPYCYIHISPLKFRRMRMIRLRQSPPK